MVGAGDAAVVQGASLKTELCVTAQVSNGVVLILVSDQEYLFVVELDELLPPLCQFSGTGDYVISIGHLNSLVAKALGATHAILRSGN